MMENWISWLWSALPFLASNAIVFTVAYFSIKSDVQEEIAHRTAALDGPNVDADPDVSVWRIRILNAGLVLCVILPTVGFSADKWIRLFRSESGHNGSVGLCDLLLSCGIWGGGICVLDKILPEFPILRGRLKKINIYLPYIRWTLLSLCSTIFTNTWYNAHLLSSAFPDNPISADPILGLFFPAGLTANGRVVMDAMAGIAIAGWFPGRVPAERFVFRLMKVYYGHLFMGFVLGARHKGLFDLPAHIWSWISSFAIVQGVLDIMHDNQIVLLGGETANAVRWAAYAWDVISTFGSMLALSWRFDIAQNRSEKVEGDPGRPQLRSRSNVFIRSFAMTLFITCFAVSHLPDPRAVLIWVLIGGTGLLAGMVASAAYEERLSEFKVEPRSGRRTDSSGAEVVKEKGPPV